MKRTAILGLSLLLCLTCSAQSESIVMPEEPQKTFNIADEGDAPFWCDIEFVGGSTAMEGRKNVAITAAEFTGGYRFSQWLKVGAGIGGMYYPNSSNVRSTKRKLALPLFVNVRGNILSDDIRQVVPYWSVNMGQTFPDGLFVSPSVGLRIGEKRNALLVGIGYTLRHLKVPAAKTAGYSGVLVRIGYEF